MSTTDSKPSTSKLNQKQERFCAEYLVDLNGTQAAIRAGYSPRTAAEQASVLLTLPKIAERIALGKKAQLAKSELSATRVLEELRRLAFSDIRSLFDEDGNLRPLHTLTDEQAAAIAGCEVIKRNLTSGDGKSDTIYKIKAWDKTKGLEMLAKHFKLLTEVIELKDHDALERRLRGGRDRAARER